MKACLEPGCLKYVDVQDRCVSHGGSDAHGYNSSYYGNPWAAISPDCPRGHRARRVYAWSYDTDDPWPWFCADCKRRFKP